MTLGGRRYVQMRILTNCVTFGMRGKGWRMTSLRQLSYLLMTMPLPVRMAWAFTSTFIIASPYQMLRYTIRWASTLRTIWPLQRPWSVFSSVMAKDALQMPIWMCCMRCHRPRSFRLDTGCRVLSRPHSPARYYIISERAGVPEVWPYPIRAEQGRDGKTAVKLIWINCCN